MLVNMHDKPFADICIPALVYVAAFVIAITTSLYLLHQIQVVLQEERYLYPYRSLLWEHKNRPQMPLTATPSLWEAPILPDVQYQMKRIQTPTFLIGIDGRHQKI